MSQHHLWLGSQKKKNICVFSTASMSCYTWIFDNYIIPHGFIQCKQTVVIKMPQPKQPVVAAFIRRTMEKLREKESQIRFTNQEKISSFTCISSTVLFCVFFIPKHCHIMFVSFEHGKSLMLAHKMHNGAKKKQKQDERSKRRKKRSQNHSI